METRDESEYPMMKGTTSVPLIYVSTCRDEKESSPKSDLNKVVINWCITKANCSTRNYLLLIYEIFYSIAFPMATIFFCQHFAWIVNPCKMYAKSEAVIKCFFISGLFSELFVFFILWANKTACLGLRYQE